MKTEATDTIPIEWEHVTGVVSKQQLQVELTSGVRYLGSLTAAEPGNLVINTSRRSYTVPLSDVVAITPIEKKFVERWDVDLSAGYSFTKASDIRTVDFGLDIDYITEQRRNSLGANLNTTDDSEGADSTWWSVNAVSLRLRENRWFSGFTGRLESNDGLGLDLRTSVGYGVGRYVVQTNSLKLGLIGGMQASQEKFDEVLDGDDEETSVEALFGAEFELFRYDEPEIDLTTTLRVIPNVTDFGRVRGEFDVTLRWELIDDFFWQLKLRDSYDSEPRADDADKNNYTITTGIAWDL